MLTSNTETLMKHKNPHSVAKHPLFFFILSSAKYQRRLNSTSFAQPSHLPFSGKFSKTHPSQPNQVKKTVKGRSCLSIMLHSCIHQNANETYICVHFCAFLCIFVTIQLSASPPIIGQNEGWGRDIVILAAPGLDQHYQHLLVNNWLS